ncbi:MAG: DUF433 domain-containing protein [Terracidiphilus sp.]|jgi:uncharacterized protein (DUF433 family)
MSELYSVREAAAIAEVPAKIIRIALEKKVLTSSSQRKVGQAVRHELSVRDILFTKLLWEFPFSLSKTHKMALEELVIRRNHAVHQWQMKGPDLVFSSGEITVSVECKNIRRRLAQNVVAFHWGKRRITSDPSIMNGEPVFSGTRIPLEHVAALFRKNVSEKEIAEDFPQLSSRDLYFARLYSQLGPRPGRPRKSLQIRRKEKAA